MGVPIHRQTLAEYLTWEDEQPERHEFHNGEIYLTVGTRPGHNRIIGNFFRHLGNQLDGTSCQVFFEGMKVQIANNMVLYPDLLVTCDQQFSADDQVVTVPVLVVEVLSPSTQAYDRSQKFALYRRLSSLREYGLIDPDTQRVEVMRLGGDGLWDFIDMSEQVEVEFASVGFRLALVELFKGMDGTQQPDRR